MSRPAARIKYDEVARLIRAATACGLAVTRIIYDGERVEIVTGSVGGWGADSAPAPSSDEQPKPLLEPRL